MRAPRADLSAERIVNAAMRVLDSEGLDAFSMRGLAVHLGVTSPTLYWHVASRSEVLDEVADRIVIAARMGPPDDGETWQDWLIRRARSYRDSLLAHRDGARIVARATQLPRSVIELENELATLVSLGFTARSALQLIMTTSHYTLGQVLQQQREPTSAPAKSSDHASTPTLLTAATQLGGIDETFTGGLNLIIAGAERLLQT